jgi:hypothetical protein
MSNLIIISTVLIFGVIVYLGVFALVMSMMVALDD